MRLPIVLVVFSLIFSVAHTQETPTVEPGSTGGSFSAPATVSPPAPSKPAPPPQPQKIMLQIKKDNEEALKRIQEIENTVYPIQEETAQKLFGLQKGEYTFLRMQSETPQSAAQFFEKQKNIDRDSFAGVASYFDETFEALQAGEYWVGREGSLVNDDSALFGELQGKVMEEMQKRPDGQKLVQMLAERDMLMNKLKTSKPLYKYFSERRMWWKSYPEYETVVKEEVADKIKQLAE